MSICCIYIISVFLFICRLNSTNSEETINLTSLEEEAILKKSLHETLADGTKEVEEDEVLDCGKPVNFTHYDELVGVANRHNHPHVPEPKVAAIFKQKNVKKGEIDIDLLERRLKKAKKEVIHSLFTCLLFYYPVKAMFSTQPCILSI